MPSTLRFQALIPIVVGALSVLPRDAGGSEEQQKLHALDPVEVRAEVIPGIRPPEPNPALPDPIRRPLKQPLSMQIFLVERNLYTQFDEGDPRREAPRVFDHPIRTPVVELPIEIAGRVAGLILSEESWNPGTKACICYPSVGYYVQGRDGQVIISICHDCATVRLRSEEWDCHAGRHLDHVNLDLLLIAAEIFPEDAVLRDLLAREREIGDRSRRYPHGAGQWVLPTPPRK